ERLRRLPRRTSSAPLEREASPLAGFYTARISTKPTLQWMVLSPPYTQHWIAEAATEVWGLGPAPVAAAAS
ncbi:MAG: hypothetical protein ACAH20_00055, partial [Methylobacteriaceae bacterium]